LEQSGNAKAATP